MENLFTVNNGNDYIIVNGFNQGYLGIDIGSNSFSFGNGSILLSPDQINELITHLSTQLQSIGVEVDILKEK